MDKSVLLKTQHWGLARVEPTNLLTHDFKSDTLPLHHNAVVWKQIFFCWSVYSIFFCIELLAWLSNPFMANTFGSLVKCTHHGESSLTLYGVFVFNLLHMVGAWLSLSVVESIMSYLWLPFALASDRHWALLLVSPLCPCFCDLMWCFAAVVGEEH